MGVFHRSCIVENHVDRSRAVRVANALVDTGSGCTWVPAARLEKIGVAREKKDVRFVMADGEVVTRSVGFAVIRVGRHFAIDEVVFAEPGDRTLLGSRTLEGLNLTVDLSRKRLVASGPLPAARAPRGTPTARRASRPPSSPRASEVIDAGGLPGTHWGLVEDFVRHVNGPGPLACDGVEGRKSTVILDIVDIVDIVEGLAPDGPEVAVDCP